MPSLQSDNTLQMSQLTWRKAARRVAGSISLANQPDALEAAKDAIQETLEDWDTRADWRFTQIVAPTISLASGDGSFNLPTTFKKPYVAYLSSRRLLHYIERGNWHRLFPAETAASVPGYYTLFNEATTAQGQIFAPTAANDTLNLLYYRAIEYSGDDEDTLDIIARWNGYILAGARMRLVAMKIANDKALFWEKRYEHGILKAMEDDRRMPDQFLTFEGPVNRPIYTLDPSYCYQHLLEN